MGQVRQGERVFRKQAGNHERQGRIFRAADLNFTVKRLAALDANAVHIEYSVSVWLIADNNRGGAP